MVENVAPAQAWEALKSDPQAQLVDVRTDPEWNFVGIPTSRRPASSRFSSPGRSIPPCR